MKLEFVGTGAADFKIETDHDMKGFRRWSSMLIDDVFMIDPGPHIFDYSEVFNKPNVFDRVKTVIVTHFHGDHVNAKSVQRLLEINPDLQIAGTALTKKVLEDGGVDTKNFTLVELFQSYTFGDYTVTPVPANHCAESVHYIIDHNGQKLFYGTDGAWMMYNTWEFISKMHFDAMVLEMTLGQTVWDKRIFSHTTFEMFDIELRTLRRAGVAGAGCKVYTTHLAKNLHPDQDTVQALCNPLNVTVAYDGFVTEF